MNETVVTRLTGTGRSAVAVVGLCGPRAEEFLSVCFAPATKTPWRAGQIRYGSWRPHDDSVCKSTEGESVVLTPIASEHFEIHGHGGAAAVSRMMDSLIQLGAAAVDAATWQRHVHQDQCNALEPLIAEAEQVLTHCTTRSNAVIALQQVRGALLKWTTHWIDRLREQPQSLSELREAASDVLQRRSMGLHLTLPYRVVLAGPPNVGKSSLVNRIVGYGRSITHDEAGTTRDVVDCDTVIGGLAIRLGDTAGIRSGGGVIEREGIRRGSLAIAAADLVLVVVDPATASDRVAIEQTIRELSGSAEVLCVLNKADCISDEPCVYGNDRKWIQTIATSWDSGTDTSVTRADRSDGIDELVTAIAERLRPECSLPDSPVPINTRQAGWIEAIANAADAASALDRLQHLRSGKS